MMCLCIHMHVHGCVHVQWLEGMSYFNTQHVVVLGKRLLQVPQKPLKHEKLVWCMHMLWVHACDCLRTCVHGSRACLPIRHSMSSSTSTWNACMMCLNTCVHVHGHVHVQGVEGSAGTQCKFHRDPVGDTCHNFASSTVALLHVFHLTFAFLYTFHLPFLMRFTLPFFIFFTCLLPYDTSLPDCFSDMSEYKHMHTRIHS